MILIDHNGYFYKWWKAFHVLCCLSSSFMYGYLSCFRNVSPVFYTLDIMFESIFVISMIIEFITDFKERNENGVGSNSQSVKSLELIAKRYVFEGNFRYDLIPLIPFQLLLLTGGRYFHLFYLIKISRIFTGLRFFNVPKIMEFIKDY